MHVKFRRKPKWEVRRSVKKIFFYPSPESPPFLWVLGFIQWPNSLRGLWLSDSSAGAGGPPGPGQGSPLWVSCAALSWTGEVRQCAQLSTALGWPGLSGQGMNTLNKSPSDPCQILRIDENTEWSFSAILSVNHCTESSKRSLKRRFHWQLSGEMHTLAHSALPPREPKARSWEQGERLLGVSCHSPLSTMPWSLNDCTWLSSGVSVDLRGEHSSGAALLRTAVPGAPQSYDHGELSWRWMGLGLSCISFEILDRSPTALSFRVQK